MSEDDISLSEKRMYGETRAETHAYVASGLGITRVETAGGQVGRFSLVHRCSARDIAGASGEIAVATDEAVLVSTDDGFAATGFGPATAVGYDSEGLLAAGDGRVARYADGAWNDLGTVTDVRAIDGALVAAADGVFSVSDCDYVGLDDARDVAPGYAATAAGLYERGETDWTEARPGPHGAVAADGDHVQPAGASDGGRVHAADADDLLELADGEWRPCELPVRERVVDVTHGADTYAVTEDGTFLVETADDATADGRGGWRSRSLGVPEVAGVAVV